jgi:WD40 repeat protein
LRVLTEPVRRAGFEFDDAGLPAEMVDAVAGTPGALALLSFAASKLWELRDRRFRQLTRKAYRSLGGVGGALAQHAEATLRGMTGEEQGLVREMFRHLVTAEGTRAPLARAELDEVLGDRAHAAAVVEKLIAARLLVAAETETGGQRIEIIHEALLEAWPRLVGWRREDREGARLRDQLRAAARQWDERGRPTGLLWRGDALTEYRLWRSRTPGGLTTSEEAFAAASLSDAARGRWLRRLLLGAAFLTLAAGVVLLYRSGARTSAALEQVRASDQVSRAQVAALHLEHGRQALLAREYARAAAYLARAHDEGVDTPALRFLLAQAVRPLRLEPIVLQQGEPLASVAFSPDGARVVTAGGATKAIVWSTAGEPLFSVDLGGEVIQSAQFSPDGTRLLGVGVGGMMAVWDAATGAQVASARAHEDTIWSAQFSPDGRRIATAGRDHLAAIWSADGCRSLATLRGHGAAVLDVAWTPDGRRLATASADGTARIWDTARGALLLTLVGSSGALARTVAVSPDGALVALGADRAVRVWRIADGSEVAALSGHAGPVVDLTFTTDHRLLSASWDGTAKVWDVDGRRLQASLDGHRSRVWSVVASPDGSRVLTTSEDGTARVWDARGMLLAILSGHSSTVDGGAIDPSGHLVATASADGTARLWPMAARTPFRLLTGHDGIVLFAQFSADGERFVTTSRDRTARVWSSRTGAELAKFATESPTAVAAFVGPDLAVAVADGRRLVVRAPGGDIARELDLDFEVEELDATPGRARVLARSRQGDVALIDLASATTRKLETAPSTSARLSGDGSRAVVGDRTGQVEVWDADRGTRLLRVAAHGGAVKRTQFCAGTTQLMTAGEDGNVKFWDARGRLLRSLVLEPGYLASPWLPLVTPDCAFLVTAGDGRPLVVLDAANGRALDHVEARSGEAISVAISPGGEMLAAPDGTQIWTWDYRPESDTASLARFARCVLPYRVEGADLIPVSGRDPDCAP